MTLNKQDMMLTIAHKHPELVPGVDWFFKVDNPGQEPYLAKWPAGAQLPDSDDLAVALAACAASAERAWRDSELPKADIEINKAADTESPTVSAWRQYREALRQWPQSAEFPEPSSRPKPPPASSV